MSENTPAPQPILKTLSRAANGLLFPSETDAPLEPFFWPAPEPTPVSEETVLRLSSRPPGGPVKKVKLESFFRPATKEEDWHNDEERAEVARFKELVATLKENLKDVQVFRVGDTKFDVYIVGTVEGGYAGLKTQVVET